MASKWDHPFWIGDRLFTPADIELIRWTTDRFGGLKPDGTGQHDLREPALESAEQAAASS